MKDERELLTEANNKLSDFVLRLNKEPEYQEQCRQLCADIRDYLEVKVGGFCIQCRQEIESFEGLDCCPFCQTRETPCDYGADVILVINWHELRILCLWAMFHAKAQKREIQSGMIHTLRGIFTRIKSLRKEKWPPIELDEELQELSNKLRKQVILSKGNRIETVFQPENSEDEEAEEKLT